MKEICELSKSDSRIVNELATSLIVAHWPKGTNEVPQAIFKFAFECFCFLTTFLSSVGKMFYVHSNAFRTNNQTAQSNRLGSVWKPN